MSSSRMTSLENLLEAVPDALVGMDQECVIRFVNHQTEALFGYDREELVGVPIDTLVPETLQRIYFEHRDSYFADPRSRSMGLDVELKGRKKDGSDFPVRIHLSHIDTGDVLLVMGAAGGQTKRKQAIENAERMTAIVENSDDAIIGETRDGVITSWNSAAERMYGYTSEEIIGKSMDLVIPEDRPRELGAIRAEIRRGKRVDHFETVRLRKDGTAINVSMVVSPIRNAEGEVVGASSIARDETQATEAFDAARAMIESSLDALVAISPEGLITDLNEATVKITGRSRQELIGTAFSDCFAEPEKAHETHLQAIDEGAAAYYPLSVRHEDGTLTEVLYNASVYRNPEGELLGVFAAARDVSAVTRAFAASRSMIESSLDALVAISPEGLITDLNEATVRLTGIPREELKGTAFSNCFTEPEKANVIYQKVFADGMAVDYPLTIRHRDGTLTEVMYNASVYRDPEGEVLGVFAAARDVTQQRKAQAEAALQREQEQARLQELEKFHEMSVGRELKMIDLKKEIEGLRAQLHAAGDLGDDDDRPDLHDFGG